MLLPSLGTVNHEYMSPYIGLQVEDVQILQTVLLAALSRINEHLAKLVIDPRPVECSFRRDTEAFGLHKYPLFVVGVVEVEFVVLVLVDSPEHDPFLVEPRVQS